MNILKSSNLNSMTLKKSKTLIGNIVLYDLFYVCVKFHENFIIKCSNF
jgi:hypothetical protein